MDRASLCNDLSVLGRVYEILFMAALVFLAVLVILCLIRAIVGPRIADRVVAVNMMGTMVMVIIAILALLLREGYLVDICLIYAMISFLAVIILTKVYMGVYTEWKQHREGRALRAMSLRVESAGGGATAGAETDGLTGQQPRGTAGWAAGQEDGGVAGSSPDGIVSDQRMRGKEI